MTKLVATTILDALSTCFGGHWAMFTFFFLLNVLDFLTSLSCLYLRKAFDRRTVTRELLLKLGYWVIIAIAFILSGTLVGLGDILGIDLHVSLMIGWFVLVGLMFDEIRAIFRSLTKIGVHVPLGLSRFLLIAENAVDNAENAFLEKSEEAATSYAGEIIFDMKDPKKPTLRMDIQDLSALQTNSEVKLKVVNQNKKEGR